MMMVKSFWNCVINFSAVVQCLTRIIAKIFFLKNTMNYKVFCYLLFFGAVIIAKYVTETLFYFHNIMYALRRFVNNYYHVKNKWL